jgi:EthD domain
MWGDSLDDVRRALAEPRYMEVIRPDEEKFLDLANCVFIVTEEVPMKG